MTKELKDGTTTEDPRLDRLVQFDDKSRQYPIRGLLGAAPRRPRSYTWGCGDFLDQGQEGACVGFAWAHELAANPARCKDISNDYARSIYRRAQELDEWPGGEPSYSGTSVLAGAKAVQELGKVTEYRWAFGLQDVIDALGYHGPVVLGVNWYEGMYNTDSQGFIRVQGEQVGGHAILARGVNHKNRLVKLRNSWGPDWGVGGGCYISFDDLDRLLREQGEACVPVVRKR